MEVAGAERVPLGDDGPPLALAARLVQEDLVLMRRDATGWRLTAASLCFPSSWTLREKFGRPLGEIHAPVPGFGAGTRTATLIDRIFDKLQPAQPVERFNWSLQAGDALYHPLSGLEREDRAAGAPGPLRQRGRSRRGLHPRRAADAAGSCALSGDILFTIRIYLDPLSVLARHPDRRQLAASFAAQLSAIRRRSSTTRASPPTGTGWSDDCATSPPLLKAMPAALAAAGGNPMATTSWPVYGEITGPVVMIGFGSIGRGTLPLIERHFKFDKSRMMVIDPQRHRPRSCSTSAASPSCRRR